VRDEVAVVRQPRHVSRQQVEDWVRRLSQTAVDEFRSAGLGTDVRLEGDGLVAAMLVVDETLVHLDAFADDGE